MAMSTDEREPIGKGPLGFISDIHGNLPALEAVLEELERREIEALYVAGDLLLGGDDAVEVFQRLSRASARAVQGTSDAALARFSPEDLEPKDERERELARRFAATRAAIGELALYTLRTLPSQRRIPLMDGREIVVVHGSPADPTIEMSHDLDDEELSALIADDPADIIVCGSSHVPFQRDIEGVRIVNVGSVGAAPEGNVAHFTVITPRLDGAVVEQSSVSY